MGHCFSMENYPVPVVASKKFILKLINNTSKCQSCETRKLMKLLRKIPGVHSTSIDANTGQVTISGTVDPQVVIWVLEGKNIKADLLVEEIPSMKKKQEMQMKTLPVLPVVDQELHGQNLVAKVLGIANNEGGLKELEITLKATFNGKNKAGMSLKSDTHKKIDVNDDYDGNPKSPGHVHNSYYSRHHDHGPNVHNVHNSNYSHYGNYPPPPAPSGRPPLKRETPWQGNYFPPPKPVASYEPSAPPWSYGYHGYPYDWSS